MQRRYAERDNCLYFKMFILLFLWFYKLQTRIFVTHGISYLRYVDIVVVMKDGVISEIGSCEELIKQRGAFADFLANYFNAVLEYSSAEEDGRFLLNCFVLQTYLFNFVSSIYIFPLKYHVDLNKLNPLDPK